MNELNADAKTVRKKKAAWARVREVVGQEKQPDGQRTENKKDETEMKNEMCFREENRCMC